MYGDGLKCKVLLLRNYGFTVKAPDQKVVEMKALPSCHRLPVKTKSCRATASKMASNFGHPILGI